MMALAQAQALLQTWLACCASLRVPLVGTGHGSSYAIPTVAIQLDVFLHGEGLLVLHILTSYSSKFEESETFSKQTKN